MPFHDTLSKFGVPLGQEAPKIGMLQPKPKHRFRVRVADFGSIPGAQAEFTRQIATIDKPKVQQPEVSVHSYNSIAYYAGKHEWQTINVTLRDDISNRISKLVGHQMQKQINHFEQTGYPAGVNYKFTMWIEVMDGGNQKILEQWFLEGCFLTNTDFGDLDYSSAEPQMISLTVRYDNAQYWGEDGAEVLMPESPLGAGDQLDSLATTPSIAPRAFPFI